MGQLTYTTQEVQDRLDAVGTLVRPNLLDNAYFVGGGSQQGNGQFPVNQRGATAYNSSGYTIDRWQVGINNAVAVQSDCVKITDPSGNHQNWKIFTQKLPNADQYRGKTLTMSILCGDTVTAGLAKPLIRIESNGSYVSQVNGEFLTANNLATVTWTIPTSGTFDTVVAGIMETTTGAGSYKIIAMKLEIGDTQTLAHQENGVWVLNEIPNYEVELAKCQRYFQNLNLAGNTYLTCGINTAKTETAIDVWVPLCVPMRTTPTVSYTGTVVLVRAGNYSVTSLSVDIFSGSYIKLKTVSSGLTVGEAYVLQISGAGTITLSADL